MKIANMEDIILLNNTICNDIEKVERINMGISSVDGTKIDSKKLEIIELLLIEKQRLISEIIVLRKNVIESMFSSSGKYTYNDKNEFSMTNTGKLKRKNEVSR